jgi:hypothetical protein
MLFNFAMLVPIMIVIYIHVSFTFTFLLCTNVPSYFINLKLHFDKDHRGHFLADLKLDKPFVPLRPRMHQPHYWDERYALYIWCAGLLELVRVFNTGLPVVDPSLLLQLWTGWISCNFITLCRVTWFICFN